MPKDQRPCPVCKLDRQDVIAERNAGDTVTYDCNRCGRFTLSGTANAIAEQGNKLTELSGWLRERSVFNIDIPMLTYEFMEELVKSLPVYSPLEKQRKLLSAIEELTDYPGKEVILIPEQEASLAWATNDEEFRFYAKSLIDRGLIEIQNPKRSVSDPLFPVVVTANGWEHLEENHKNSITSKQAFVAMSFDDSLRSVYDNAIKPAIDAVGYRPFRVDAEHHLERIDAKIISEIKRSRFIVADVTQQKAGVYYEAGFAHGLGIPVIWSVTRDELEKVHFDTRQYNHILWETEKELEEKLKDVILATIGKS